MCTFIQLHAGVLEKPTGCGYEDGRRLVASCIRDRSSLGESPPKLFILWMTRAFHPYIDLLEGVQSGLSSCELAEVPLVGASVAACTCDDQVLAEGALLVGLTSPYIEAKAAMVEHARLEPGKATDQLFQELGLSTGGEVNPHDDQFLLVFTPGFGHHGDPSSYVAGDLFTELRARSSSRLPIFGGAASAGLKKGKRGVGHQFCGKHFAADAVVGALVTSKVAFGNAVQHAFTDTGAKAILKPTDEKRVLEVKDLPDIGGPQSALHIFLIERSSSDVVLLGRRSGQNRVQVNRDMEEATSCRVMSITKEALEHNTTKLQETLIASNGQSYDDVQSILEVSCLSLLDHLPKEVHEQRLAKAKQKFPNLQHVYGCFVDGEIGTDQFGRSVQTNFSVAQMLFYDSVSARSWARIAFELPLAASPSPNYRLNNALDRSLARASKSHYPGGMISFVLEDQGEKFVVGRRAIGERWQPVVKMPTRRKLESDDVLAEIVRTGQPIYISDACQDPRSDVKTATKNRIYSFIGLPLRDFGNDVVGVLQIDLGDRRTWPAPEVSEQQLLQILADRASSGLSRANYKQELESRKRLGDWLLNLLNDGVAGGAAQDYCDMIHEMLSLSAHVRIWDPASQRLVLSGGTGQYYEALCKHDYRLKIDPADVSPSAHAFRRNQRLIVNQAGGPIDQMRIRLERQEADGDAPTGLANAFESFGSFVNYPLTTKDSPMPLGIVCFGSNHPWHFTPTILRILDSAVSYLSFTLMRMENVLDDDYEGDSKRHTLH